MKHLCLAALLVPMLFAAAPPEPPTDVIFTAPGLLAPGGRAGFRITAVHSTGVLEM